MLSSAKQSVLRQTMPGPPLAIIATMILSSIHYIKALYPFGRKARKMLKIGGACTFALVTTFFSVIAFGALAQGKAMDSSPAPTMGIASTIKIVAIGASNTAGWGVGSENAYPAQLQLMLQTRGYNVQVANAGKSFDTTTGMLRRLDAAVPKGTSMVIVQPGGNDFRFFGSKEQRAANIVAIADRLRAGNIKVIMFENKIVPSNLYQWDGIHFTTKGHKWIASYLMRPVLASIDTYGIADQLSSEAPKSLSE